jgi:8-oxo-dGTP pyrophosphatase MutT (NUDIX family)
MTSADTTVSPISQAGAVVFRTDTPLPQVLLVRAKKDPSQWIFPKGHLQQGESHAAAALREAQEEAGVRGMALGLITTAVIFQSGDELVNVEYFLILFVDESPSPEGREKQWVSLSDALDQLAFEDARSVLNIALVEIEGRAAQRLRHDGFDEFLLHEYDHLGQSLLANEESGEKRVVFFLTLCGVVGAALGFVIGEGTVDAPERGLVAVSLMVLFVLGYATFLRVVVRNAASDRYKNQLARLRQRFLGGQTDPRIAFLPFNPYVFSRRKRRISVWRLGKGGWAETMALVESLIGGSAVAFAVSALLGRSVGVLVAASIIGVGAGCYLWRQLLERGDKLYEQEMAHPNDGSAPLRASDRV